MAFHPGLFVWIISMTVGTLATLVQGHEGRKQVAVFEGDTLALPCPPVKEGSKVKWTSSKPFSRHGAIYTSAMELNKQQQSVTVSKNHHLVFVNGAHGKDATTYTCSVTYANNSVATMISEVTVYGLPKCEVSLREKSKSKGRFRAKQGDQFDLTCKVYIAGQGARLPTMFWTNHDGTVESRSSIKGKYGFENVSVVGRYNDDDNLYTCIVPIHKHDANGWTISQRECAVQLESYIDLKVKPAGATYEQDFHAKNESVHKELGMEYFKKFIDYSSGFLGNMSFAEARQDMLRMSRGMTLVPYDGSIEDRRIPSKNVTGGIPVRIYKPYNLPEVPQILVYFHGGGQVVGDLEITRNVHRTLSQLSSLIIVDVDYRLAPEYRLPAGLDDCAEVTRWVLDNKKEVGGAEDSAVGVGGDSAGGQSVIYVTHDVKGLAFQILVYPWCDLTSPAAKTYEWLISRLLEAGASKADKRWSPLYHTAEDSVSQPPALIIQAQIDDILDEGRRYAKLLIDAGVFTSILEVKGAEHGFYYFPDLFPKMTAQAYNQVSNFLRGIQAEKE